MFKWRHRSCDNITLHNVWDRKWWLSYGLWPKRVYSTTILSMEKCVLRMYPNTSVGFS